jgi:aspartate/methionine/tyrosine aminotransferase
MIHEVSGVSGALQGKAPTSGTSAARYAMESQNATTTIYPLIKKFNGFEERLAQKKCITMQQYYEEGRDITPRKSEKQVFYRANAARNVKFNVSIKNAASSAAFLQLGNEMLDRLLEMQAIDVRTYLKNYDAPFAEKLLQAEHVALVPGSAFGACGEGHVRCSYATSIDKISEALNRIENFLKNHRK